MCPSVDLLPQFVLVLVFFVVRAVTPIIAPRPATPQRGSRHSVCNVLTTMTVVEPRGLEPRTSAVQGRRSPS